MSCFRFINTIEILTQLESPKIDPGDKAIPCFLIVLDKS